MGSGGTSGRARALGWFVGLGAAFAVGVGLRRRQDPTGLTAPVRTRTVTTVNRPVDEVYRRWRQLEDLPTFTTHLESVRVTGDRTSHWVAKGPVGTVEWDATITVDRPGEVIAWRSVEGADVDHAGEVRFRPAPGDRGTEVEVDLIYEVPGGRLGRIVARVLGEHPEQQAKDDLRRFKQLLETGEIPRSSGSPEGTRAARQWKQEAAR